MTKEAEIHQALDLAVLFKMTVLQVIDGEKKETLFFYVIAGDLAEAVDTMHLSIEEYEQAFPGIKMILLGASTLGDGIRIAPALAADIVSQITNGNQSQVQN